MKVVLELQDQPSNVRRITVRHDIVIGRGSDCNLRLSAPQVSRRHCFLRVGRDSVSVTDLDSSNGTFIDGTRITAGKRYDIANGAQLALGPIRFIIHVRSDVAVAGTAKSGSAPDSKRSRSGRDAVAGFVADDNSTVNAQMGPEHEKAQMDFAVEQAGESAEPHEPTADYLDDQFPANGSANLFSNAPDPDDSRLDIADFGKRHAEQLESNQETNDFPAGDIAGKSANANEEPQWNSTVADSSGSPENVDAASVADDDVESAWLSVADDDTFSPEPMNLGNAYVGESSHDALNDIEAELIEEVDEVAEVQESLDVEEVVEVEDTLDEVVISEAEELVNVEEAAEIQATSELEEVAVVEEASVDAQDSEVQDWLNFDEVAEVQESLDVEEVVEVEDTLEKVVISEAEELVNVEEATGFQPTNELEEVAVVEEASVDAQDSEVQDWLNVEEVAEVQESLDVEEVVEVEDALEGVVVGETDDVAVIEVEDVPEFEEVEQIQESMEVAAAIPEPPTAEDALEIAVEEDSDSNWFASDEVSESDAFFDNFISPEIETDNTSSPEAAEKDNDIDPDLQNFLKGF